MNFILNNKLKMYITISFFAYFQRKNHNKNKNNSKYIELKPLNSSNCITHKG